MTQRTLRRALSAAAVCAVLPALAPAAASASTYTVDDDKAQCPGASFTSIQAAVDQAAPWDTVIICDGLYEEQSRPSSGVESPSAPNSVNGLTITKPLTLKGAGASKVTIMPRQSLATLAGDTPYLRDGGGNVVTVSKQSRDATDMNTIFVDISGVTITSGVVYAEAGVAFFDASGAIRDSVVGPLVRASSAPELAARPHGWGVVSTNHYQGAEAGPRREITVEGTLVRGFQSGGILFDDARGTDGSPESLLRSGIVSYGFVRDSTVEGAGPDGTIPQTGVQYHAGQRGAVTGSTIRGNYFTPDTRRSVGVLLTDAETRADPASPGVRGLYVYNNILQQNGYGLFNADAANSAVRTNAPAAATTGAFGVDNYWGCTTGPLVGAPSANDTLTGCQGISGADGASAASVELGPTRTVLPRLPAAPGATADAAPTASFGDPSGGTIAAGAELIPTVIAKDDFGVRSVSLTVDGVPVGTKATAPYEFDGFTPGYDEIGETYELTTTVVDSAGQTTVSTEQATVVAPTGYAPITVAPATVDAGAVFLGAKATKAVTIANSGKNPLTLTSVSAAGGGFAATGGCTSGTLAPGASCAVDVTFAPTTAGAASGTLTVAYSAIGGSSPATVALSGSGVAPTTPPPPARREPSRAARIAASFARTTKASRRGLLTLVTLRNSGGRTGTVRVTGTLRVGRARFAIRVTRRVGAGKRVTVSVRLSRRARLALRRRGGTLTLRVVGAGSRGITRRITVRRG